MSQTVIFYNNQIHQILADQPDRNQVIKQIDKINSLEHKQKVIPYYITSEWEFNLFKRFVNLIHKNCLETSEAIFYIELPKNLYDWIKKNSFKDLLAQISAYFAFCEMVYEIRYNRKSILTDNFYPIIKNSIKNKKEEIGSTKISFTDLIRYRNLYRRFRMNYLDRERNILTFKYWKYSEISYNTLPIPPFLTKDSNSENWVIDKDLMNFQITTYFTKKGYKTITKNRFNAPAFAEYTNKNLERWKEIYKYNLDQESNIYGDDIKIINAVKHINFKERLECQLCHNALEFERQTDLRMSENHTLLCNNCYLEEYFEKEL